jgi:hypothetical protein
LGNNAKQIYGHHHDIAKLIVVPQTAENYSLETSDGYCTGTDSSSFHSYTNVAGKLFVRILLLPKTYIFIFQ